MTEIATPGQLRMSYWRWAMVTVPSIVLVGSLMGLLSNSGYNKNTHPGGTMLGRSSAANQRLL